MRCGSFRTTVEDGGRLEGGARTPGEEDEENARRADVEEEEGGFGPKSGTGVRREPREEGETVDMMALALEDRSLLVDARDEIKVVEEVLGSAEDPQEVPYD